MKEIRYMIVVGLLLLSLLFSSCKILTKSIKITVIFDKIYNLHIDSPVKLDNMKIGEVINITQKGQKISVIIKIYKEYGNKITFGSKFYLINKKDESYIKIKVINPNAEPIKNNSIVYGSNYSEYLWETGKEKLKDTFDRSYKKVREYFKSDEWNNFKNEMQKQIKEAAKKGQDELKKQLPKIKKQADKLVDKTPEIIDKANSYIDSLYKKYSQEDKKKK